MVVWIIETKGLILLHQNKLKNRLADISKGLSVAFLSRSKAARFFFLVLFLTASLISLLLFYVPKALDDLWFLDGITDAPGLHAFSSACAVLVKRLSTDTGRLGAIISPVFLALLPKWVYNILTGIFFILLVEGSRRLAKVRAGGLELPYSRNLPCRSAVVRLSVDPDLRHQLYLGSRMCCLECRSVSPTGEPHKPATSVVRCNDLLHCGMDARRIRHSAIRRRCSDACLSGNAPPQTPTDGSHNSRNGDDRTLPCNLEPVGIHGVGLGSKLSFRRGNISFRTIDHIPDCFYNRPIRCVAAKTPIHARYGFLLCFQPCGSLRQLHVLLRSTDHHAGHPFLSCGRDSFNGTFCQIIAA